MNAKLVAEIVLTVGGAVCGGIWAASQLVGRLKRSEKDITGISTRERMNAELAHRRYIRVCEVMMTLCRPEDRKWLADYLNEEIRK